MNQFKIDYREKSCKIII